MGGRASSRAGAGAGSTGDATDGESAGEKEGPSFVSLPSSTDPLEVVAGWGLTAGIVSEGVLTGTSLRAGRSFVTVSTGAEATGADATGEPEPVPTTASSLGVDGVATARGVFR